jgi:hypothetical protein
VWWQTPLGCNMVSLRMSTQFHLLQVDADLSHIEAELAALALQKRKAEAAASAAAAVAAQHAGQPASSVSCCLSCLRWSTSRVQHRTHAHVRPAALGVHAAACRPPPLPPRPLPASPAAPARSEEVELSTEGLVVGLSALAAQDGGFPGDMHTPADPAPIASSPPAEATPLRKRLLQRHRVSSGSNASPAAAAAAVDEVMAEAAAPAAADAVGAAGGGGPAAVGADDDELAFAAELLALPEMTEVGLPGCLHDWCTVQQLQRVDASATHLHDQLGHMLLTTDCATHLSCYGTAAVL